MEAGFDVKKSEVHGMSQRGGDVITTIRYGEKIYSPIVGEDSADLILAFEKLEALRTLKYLRKDGTMLINDYRWDPIPVATGTMEYPEEEILPKIREKTKHIQTVDALAKAKELGNIKVVNLYLLGLLAKELGLDETFLESDPAQGWKISLFVPNARTLDDHDAAEVKIAMEMGRRLHESGAQLDRRFDYLVEGRTYEELLAQFGPIDVPGDDEPKEKAARLKAYVLVGGIEPADLVPSPAIDASLRGADCVVAITPYASEEILASASVILPSAVFAESAGTWVNAEGRWQSVAGAAKPAGEARPAWKILRVLGNLLGFAGFEYVSSEEVRDELRRELDSYVGGVTAAALLAGVGHAVTPVAAGSPLVLTPVRWEAAALARKAGAEIVRLETSLRCGDGILQAAEAEDTFAVLGSRMLGMRAQGQRLPIGIYSAGRNAINLFFVLLFGSRLTDIATCYKPARRAVFKAKTPPRESFALDTAARGDRHGLASLVGRFDFTSVTLACDQFRKPLSDLRGEIDFEPGRVVLHDLAGRIDRTQLHIEGAIEGDYLRNRSGKLSLRWEAGGPAGGGRGRAG